MSHAMTPIRNPLHFPGRGHWKDPSYSLFLHAKAGCIVPWLFAVPHPRLPSWLQGTRKWYVGFVRWRISLESAEGRGGHSVKTDRTVGLPCGVACACTAVVDNLRSVCLYERSARRNMHKKRHTSIVFLYHCNRSCIWVVTRVKNLHDSHQQIPP